MIKMDENCDHPICLPGGQHQSPLSNLNTQLFRIKLPDLETLTHHPPSWPAAAEAQGQSTSTI